MFLCDQVICFGLFDTQNQWFSFHGSPNSQVNYSIYLFSLLRITLRVIMP